MSRVVPSACDALRIKEITAGAKNVVVVKMDAVHRFTLGASRTMHPPRHIPKRAHSADADEAELKECGTARGLDTDMTSAPALTRKSYPTRASIRVTLVN
jgi:hypothetical protein